MPLRTKVVVTVLALVSLFLYLVVVDLGINAGRIHRGVAVGEIDVGGMSRDEAFRHLDAIAQEMRETPVVFSTERLNFYYTPKQFGWSPRPWATSGRAMEVGRSKGPFKDLYDRAIAWSAGVSVGWDDRIGRSGRVGARLNQLEEQAIALGLELDRPEMRFRIRRAIRDWPRKSLYEIPVSPAP